MMRLPNIDINENMLNNLFKYNILAIGSEGIIIEVSDKILYKIFKSSIINGKYEEIDTNKEKKINLLYNSNIRYLTLPIATISVNNTIIGYALNNYNNYVSLYDMKLSRIEKINILKKTSRILKYFHDNDIIYGDVYCRNILVNPKNMNPIFCDSDNVMIGAYPFDLTSSSVSRYIKSRKGIDVSIDAYTHNIMTIDRIVFSYDNLTRGDILNSIYEDGDYIAYSLIDSNKMHEYGRVRRITNEILDPKKFNGEYIINYL